MFIINYSFNNNVLDKWAHGKAFEPLSQVHCCWKSKWLSLLKKVKNACQIWFLAKFAHIPTKSAVYYWLFFGEVCPENSCKIGQFLHEFVSENPAKFDFFLRPIRSPDYFITFQSSPNPLSFYFRKNRKTRTQML